MVFNENKVVNDEEGTVSTHDEEEEIIDIDLFDDEEQDEGVTNKTHPLESIESGNGRLSPKEGEAVQPKKYFIFAYSGLIIAGFNLLASVAWVVSYARGYGWRRNPTAVAWKLEKPVEESHEVNRQLLDAHAIMGVTFLVMCFYQFASPILFGQHDVKDSLGQYLRAGHSILGQFVSVLTIFTVVTGAVFTITSDRYHHDADGEEYSVPTRIYLMSMLWVGGIGILINFAIGLKQVLFVKEKTPSGMLLHKGCMFFGFFYIGQFGIIEVAIRGAQLASPHCALGSFGKVLCLSIPGAIQLVAMLLAFWRFESTLFEHKFVQYNLVFFAGQVLLACLPIPYLLAYPPANDNCLGAQH